MVLSNSELDKRDISAEKHPTNSVAGFVSSTWQAKPWAACYEWGKGTEGHQGEVSLQVSEIQVAQVWETEGNEYAHEVVCDDLSYL